MVTAASGPEPTFSDIPEERDFVTSTPDGLDPSEHLSAAVPPPSVVSDETVSAPSYAVTSTQEMRGSVHEVAPSAETDAASSRSQHGDVGVQQTIGSNYGTVVGVVENLRWMLNYHDLTEQYIQTCVQRFAPPADIGKAMQLLNDLNIVVLVAEADSGRHDTAVYLLQSLADVTAREVRREPDDRIDVGALAVETRSGWLLDLRHETELGHSFGRSLLGEQQRLRARGSYLVVIVPSSLWNEARAGAEELAYQLAPVDATDIVRARLRVSRAPIDVDAYLRDSRIRQRLAHASPSEAVLWADAIVQVHAAPVELEEGEDEQLLSAETITARQVEAVLKVRGNWRLELLAWHITYPDSRMRNFLLAAAVLQGCTAGQIFYAASGVAQALGEDPPKVEGQCGAGILELIDRVGAQMPDDERVVFARPGYADAVLDYFWVDRQHLRTQFVTWMCQLPLSLDEKVEDVTERIADYVLRWTERHRVLKLFRDVARRWAKNARLRPALTQLITAAALHPDIGKKVRDELLDWAKNDGEAIAVKILVAEVCGGDLVRFHPQAALYRLGTLARCTDQSVAEAVTGAVGALWARADLREHIVTQVATWCAGDDDGRKRAGVSAFLTLARLRHAEHGLPELMPRNDRSRDQRINALICGWRAVLETRPASTTSGAALAVWLDAAHRSPDVQSLLQDILTTALRGTDEADTDDRRFVFLLGLLYDWQPANLVGGDRRGIDIREAIIRHLLRAIPELRPLNAPPLGHGENLGETTVPDV